MTRKERLAYYIGDTGRNFCQAVLATFMTIFLMFKGIDVTAVAGIVLIVKIIDAFDDVIFGFFVDRIDPTKWKFFGKLAGQGKYLPWYRLTFFMYPLVIILFFLMPSGFSQGGKLIWFTVFYLLYDLTCTLAEVPMNSMVMTLTDNVEERNSILKAKGIIITIGAIGIGMLWQFLISEHVGFSVVSIAIISAASFLICMIPLATSVREHNAGLKNIEKKEEVRYSFKEMWKCIRTNKYIMIFFASQIIISVLSTQTALSNFISFYCFGDSMMMSYAIMVAFIPGIFFMMKADKIAAKMGKRNALIFFNLIIGAASLALYVIGPSYLALCFALVTIGGVPTMVKLILNTYIAPDTIEYTRYKTGQDCSGIFYSLNSFVSKVTAGVAGSMGMFIIGIFGWIPVEATDFADLAAQGVVQPQSAIDALWATNSLIPGIGCLLSTVFLLFYHLKDSDAKLMAQCNAGVITREECEAGLIGKYEKRIEKIA